MSAVARMIRQEVDRLKDRLAGSIVKRGLISVGVSADFFMQATGASDAETMEEAECMQHYGYASRPPAGSEMVAVCPNASGEAAVSVAESNRAHRPADLDDGEVSVHGPKGTGQAELRFRTNGNLEMKGGGTTPGKLEMFSNTGKTELTANGGAITITAAGILQLVPAALSAVMLGSTLPADKALKGTTFNAHFATFMGDMETYKTGTWANVLANWSSYGSSQKEDACRDAISEIFTLFSALLVASTTPAGAWLADKVWVD